MIHKEVTNLSIESKDNRNNVPQQLIIKDKVEYINEINVFVLNTTFNLTETSKEPPKNDMFMFVNMLVIDRYTAIGNTSSTKSLPSIY